MYFVTSDSMAWHCPDKPEDVVLYCDSFSYSLLDQPEFGFVSKNPVLKNITDYLVDEGSFEEDELMGRSFWFFSFVFVCPGSVHLLLIKYILMGIKEYCTW